MPYSYYQKQLFALFGKASGQLGLLEDTGEEAVQTGAQVEEKEQ